MCLMKLMASTMLSVVIKRQYSLVLSCYVNVCQILTKSVELVICIFHLGDIN